MNACHTRPDCSTCPERMLCHCLQVTEEMLQDALVTLELKTLRDVREATGAGDGCTACHRRLRRFLEQETATQPSASSSPI